MRDFRRTRLPTNDGEAPSFKEFSGLINTRSAKDIGFDGLRRCTNLLITDTKKVQQAPGYLLARAGSNIYGVWGGAAGMYVAEGSTILFTPSNDPADLSPVVTGLTGKEYVWDEVNTEVFYVNGKDAGMLRSAAHLPLRITPPAIASISVASLGSATVGVNNIGASYDEVTWRFAATYVDEFGRESAPSGIVEIKAPPYVNTFQIIVPPMYEATSIYATRPDGTDFRRLVTTRNSAVVVSPHLRHEVLESVGTHPMPDDIEQIVWMDGRLWGSRYLPVQDVSYLWCSDPFAYHLWRPAVEGIALPGRVALMQRADKGMVVGTTKWVFHYDGETLTTLCKYGVVPGQAGDATAEGVVYFWTTRGFCKAMPFENLTEKNLSVAPGTVAYSKLLYLDGMMQFVTLTDGGGQAFNQRIERE